MSEGCGPEGVFAVGIAGGGGRGALFSRTSFEPGIFIVSSFVRDPEISICEVGVVLYCDP
jgi:hypothetical protein